MPTPPTRRWRSCGRAANAGRCAIAGALVLCVVCPMPARRGARLSCWSTILTSAACSASTEPRRAHRGASPSAARPPLRDADNYTNMRDVAWSSVRHKPMHRAACWPPSATRSRAMARGGSRSLIAPALAARRRRASRSIPISLRNIRDRAALLGRDPAAAALFLPDGAPLAAGHLFRQPRAHRIASP